jgi:DNA-binding transcriptional LysR family regulator
VKAHEPGRSGLLLELRELESFVAVALRGSFTAAARELRFDQSTVTRHVQQLERDLRLDLFVRPSRRVELTEQGREFLPYARRVLDAARRASDFGESLTRRGRAEKSA